MTIRALDLYLAHQERLLKAILKNSGISAEKADLELNWKKLTKEDAAILGKTASEKLHITCYPEEVEDMLGREHVRLELELKIGVKSYDTGEERYVGKERISYCLSNRSCENRQQVEKGFPICTLEEEVSGDVPESLTPEQLDKGIEAEVEVHKYYESEKKGHDIGLKRALVDFLGRGLGIGYLRRHIDPVSARQRVERAFGKGVHASLLLSFETALYDVDKDERVVVDAFDVNCCVRFDYPGCDCRDEYPDKGLPKCRRRARPLDISIGHLGAEEVDRIRIKT